MARLIRSQCGGNVAVMQRGLAPSCPALCRASTSCLAKTNMKIEVWTPGRQGVHARLRRAIRAFTPVFDGPSGRSRPSSTGHQGVHARLRRAIRAFTPVFDGIAPGYDEENYDRLSERSVRTVQLPC